MKIRLLQDVRSDLPFPPFYTAMAGIYEDSEISINSQGAVSVLTEQGTWLGIKPDEMEWIEK